MKKIFVIGLIAASMLLMGCDDVGALNVEENNEIISINGDFENNMVEIGECMYYDQTTNIVYLWNGHQSSEYATMPSPYYASNGLPYKYNPKTGTLYMIEQEE